MAKAPFVAPVTGYVLISREQNEKGRWGDWYVAWLEPFKTKKKAIGFAKENRWHQPYQAVRGRVCVDAINHPTANRSET